MKKYQPGGLVDSEGNPVRDSSGQPIMTESGRDEMAFQKRMKEAEDKLGREAQEYVKNKGDADRMAYDAEQGAKAPEAKPSVAKKAAPKAGKSGIVTKEELAKSGLSLRDYMNKQKGLTRRDGKSAEKAPAKAPSKAESAERTKSDFLASQRKRSDLIRDLTKAEREAPAGTTALAKQKIAEAKRKAIEDYGYASEAENRKGYVPRATPGARAPKQTTSKAKPYMPERPNMSFAKGGSVSSASKRADGIAKKGKTRCKVY